MLVKGQTSNQPDNTRKSPRNKCPGHTPQNRTPRQAGRCERAYDGNAMEQLTDAEWQACVGSLATLRQVIESWPTTEPSPSALRCEFSRHRTLAHLRAAQETWLEAALLFAEKDFPRIVRPHPWRLFETRNYAMLPWDEHRAAYLADRSKWQELVNRPGLDRTRQGKLSGKLRTIESLTSILASHEQHHITVLEAQQRK